MAVEVINHEFQKTIKAIRANIKRLDNWAAANPPLRGPVRDLRGSFEHLDSYLTLFTPLNRRLYRKKTRITGGEIEAFVQDVFREHFSQENIALRTTEAFRAHELTQYPSTIYPVLINLIDNALYWLRDFPGDRVITLDAAARGMTVSGQRSRHRRSGSRPVFRARISAGSRGAADTDLFISREVLEREGMKLNRIHRRPTVVPYSNRRVAEFEVMAQRKFDDHVRGIVDDFLQTVVLAGRRGVASSGAVGRARKRTRRRGRGLRAGRCGDRHTRRARPRAWRRA